MFLTGSTTSEWIKIWETFQPQVIEFAKNLLIAVVILLAGRHLIKLLLKLIKKIFVKSKAEAGVTSFVSSLVKVVLYVALLIWVADILGLPTTSFIAILGSAGLTIGLALQGSLSNFAGGVLILIMKPFVIGDFIITGTNEGIVDSIDIFYTKLKTLDNRVIVMPNGALSNSNIINVTREPQRRVDLIVSIAYDANLLEVKQILESIARKSEYLLQDQPIDLYVDKFADNAINIGFRCWAAKENFWLLRCELMEEIKKQVDAGTIDIPYQQIVLHTAEKSEKEGNV